LTAAFLRIEGISIEVRVDDIFDAMFKRRMISKGAVDRGMESLLMADRGRHSEEHLDSSCLVMSKAVLGKPHREGKHRRESLQIRLICGTCFSDCGNINCGLRHDQLILTERGIVEQLLADRSRKDPKYTL
jgi:hypothetical protein